MFNKLLANLPFNPSLGAQISFYGKRLRQESSIRRIGFVFVALALIVQFFAVVSPPKPSLAYSPNNLVYNGFTSQVEAERDCNDTSPGQDYGVILAHYGITCADVGSPNTTTVTITSIDNGRNLFSMGRQTNPKGGDQPVNIAGANNGQPLYLRPLWIWDTGASSTYKALYGTTSAGLHFWIIYDCGNLVFNGIPPTPTGTVRVIPPVTLPPPVAPPVVPATISCSNLFMNVASGAQVPIGTKILVQGQAAGQNVPAGKQVNMYYEYVDVSTNKVVSTDQSLGVPFQGTIANDTTSHTFTTTGAGQFVIRVAIKSGLQIFSGSDSGNCLKNITVEQPCEASLNSQDINACLQPHKTATNVTQNVTNATKANAGDVIQYMLTTTNSGNITVPKHVVQENINYVLDYADVTDFHGGTVDSNGLVSWPAVDIKPKQTITNLLTVKVKDPIPATPVSSSDPGYFNHTLTNTYGDTVVISLPQTVVTVAQTITTTLPNTGPGTSLIVAFLLAFIVGYFFIRSRLLAKEADLVRRDYASGAGDLL